MSKIGMRGILCPGIPLVPINEMGLKCNGLQNQSHSNQSTSFLDPTHQLVHLFCWLEKEETKRMNPLRPAFICLYKTFARQHTTSSTSEYSYDMAFVTVITARPSAPCAPPCQRLNRTLSLVDSMSVVIFLLLSRATLPSRVLLLSENRVWKEIWGRERKSECALVRLPGAPVYLL